MTFAMLHSSACPTLITYLFDLDWFNFCLSFFYCEWRRSELWYVDRHSSEWCSWLLCRCLLLLAPILLSFFTVWTIWCTNDQSAERLAISRESRYLKTAALLFSFFPICNRLPLGHLSFCPSLKTGMHQLVGADVKCLQIVGSRILLIISPTKQTLNRQFLVLVTFTLLKLSMLFFCGKCSPP